MSPRIAQALLDVLSGQVPNGLAPAEKARLKEKVKRLGRDVDPAVLLAAWLHDYAPQVRLRGETAALANLRDDPRVVASGLSDPRAGLSAPAVFEGWVARADLPAVRRDHHLTLATGGQAQPNVRLRLAETPVPDPVPLGWLLADLAAHRCPQQNAAVARLLATR